MSSTDLVRVPVAIPPALRDRVTVIEQDGVRMITGLDRMSETHNILQPISEIAQADPDWSPRIVEVHIDPTLDPPKGNATRSFSGKHVYVQDNMLALRKDAILLIAKAAGIDVDVDEVDRRKLKDTEIAYKAVATMRRSDGTLERWPGGRKLDTAVEREKVKSQCYKNGALDENYFRKRWATELDFLPQKCESKAVLRAVSAALQLKRGGYTEPELSKPFLVIAWSFTPSDPEVRRELALAAAGALYGRRAIAAPEAAELVVEHRALEADDAPDPDDVAPAESSQYADPTPQPPAPPADVVDIQPSAREPGEPDPQPTVKGEIPADIAAAGDTLIGFGEAGRRGLKVCELSDEHLTWLAVEYEPTGPSAAERRGVIEQARKYRNWRIAQVAS